MHSGRPLVDVLNNNASRLEVCYPARSANHWVRIRVPHEKASAVALKKEVRGALFARK